MKHLLVLVFALLLCSCATAGAVIRPRPGETPCAFGRRVLDEAQHRLDQARATAGVVCSVVEPPTAKPGYETGYRVDETGSENGRNLPLRL